MLASVNVIVLAFVPVTAVVVVKLMLVELLLGLARLVAAVPAVAFVVGD